MHRFVSICLIQVYLKFIWKTQEIVTYVHLKWSMCVRVRVCIGYRAHLLLCKILTFRQTTQIEIRNGNAVWR